MKKLLSFILMAMFAIGVYAKDLKIFVVKPTPAMSCKNCEKKIKSNIRFVKGTASIKTDLAKQEISITFDAEKSTVEDYKAAFKKIGYTIEIVSEPKSVDAETGATPQK